MGDRSSVILKVLYSQRARVTELLDDSAGTYSEISVVIGPQDYTKFTLLTFHEVNYGELPGLLELANQGIAYDVFWEAGSSFPGGTRSIRFIPEGYLEITEVYDNERGVNILTLLDIIDAQVLQDRLKTLEDFIRQEAIRLIPRAFTEDQATYGRYYRVKRLLGLPTSATEAIKYEY